ncbi:MAG: Lrp/AsnC family transcriptional regulator [Oscillospiraceae bacterium]|nr:Lrp/AsnC family transcriptional regulator [Oscillospiraceae bacterium]
MADFVENIHLDQTDMQLLQLLMEDSKTPYAELGRQLNLSRAAITKRVNALIEKGVIERFTVYINPRRVKRDITTLFELTTMPAHTQQIMDELSKQSEIGEIYMTGDLTLFAFAYFADNTKLNEFLMRVLSRLPGLHEIKTHAILASKSNLDWNFNFQQPAEGAEGAVAPVE